MDAKDLRTESALSERLNDGNSKYVQSGAASQCDRNKLYQDVGPSSLAKMDVPTARPCAVIGPERVMPPTVANDVYPKKSPIEPWSYADNTYCRLPDYPQKISDYHHPTRNISPRQTFQENMQRVMMPPRYNSAKINEDPNFSGDRNVSISKNIKLNVPPEAKYCDVPYTVNPMSNEPKNVRNGEMCVSNINPALVRSVPHGWPPVSVNARPPRPYGVPEVYQYSEYANCTGPRPVPMTRPHREEPGHVFTDPYYHEGNIRFKPYPSVKERYPRYEYIGNYSNPYPPPSFQPHKYDLQKSIPPHPYPGHPQVPFKYLDGKITEPHMDGYQRPSNQQTNFNISFRNQVIHPSYGPVPGNCLQNKLYPYPESLVKPIPSNKLPFDNSNKMYIEYENTRPKPYTIPDSFYVNEMSRPHHMKGQVVLPNYPPVNMYAMPPHPYYRKENPPVKNYEYVTHIRNNDPSLNINNSMSRLPSQFSSNAIAISPSDSNTSNDTIQTQATLQEDCGYVSQSSTTSVRSVDSTTNRLPNEHYRRYDYKYEPVRNSSLLSKIEANNNKGSKGKKDIDVRQFLQMWNEEDDENGENNGNKEVVIQAICHDGNDFSKQCEAINNQEQLYVLGLVNVPSEELGKYEHIQKVSKLPENIKGYNSIELLNQFEEVIESSNLNNFNIKPTPKETRIPLKTSVPIQGAMPRPVSPLDVEAKISQSVIHKEVGCNFEIKPCSPKMLNVEVAAPVQTILDERVIEKVANPLIIKSPVVLPNIDENLDNCNIINHHDHRLPLNKNVKVSSCKMANTQYSTNNTVDTIKTNYILQDLESNSGVCLASLPRLDNDIELNFPEVNQQFINANKVESVITTISKELPALDIDKSNIISKENKDFRIISKSSSNVETEKGFIKLSKYRKIKGNGLEMKEHDIQINTLAIRTNSVIIKNPENIKCPVENTSRSFKSINETENEEHKEVVFIQQCEDPLVALDNKLDCNNIIPDQTVKEKNITANITEKNTVKSEENNEHFSQLLPNDYIPLNNEEHLSPLNKYDTNLFAKDSISPKNADSLEVSENVLNDDNVQNEEKCKLSIKSTQEQQNKLEYTTDDIMELESPSSVMKSPLELLSKEIMCESTLSLHKTCSENTNDPSPILKDNIIINGDPNTSDVISELVSPINNCIAKSDKDLSIKNHTCDERSHDVNGTVPSSPSVLFSNPSNNNVNEDNVAEHVLDILSKDENSSTKETIDKIRLQDCKIIEKISRRNSIEESENDYKDESSFSLDVSKSNYFDEEKHKSITSSSQDLACEDTLSCNMEYNTEQNSTKLQESQDISNQENMYKENTYKQTETSFIKLPSYLHKELFSPWIQKLLIHLEGFCNSLNLEKKGIEITETSVPKTEAVIENISNTQYGNMNVDDFDTDVTNINDFTQIKIQENENVHVDMTDSGYFSINKDINSSSIDNSLVNNNFKENESNNIGDDCTNIDNQKNNTLTNDTKSLMSAEYYSEPTKSLKNEIICQSEVHETKLNDNETETVLCDQLWTKKSNDIVNSIRDSILEPKKAYMLDNEVDNKIEYEKYGSKNRNIQSQNKQNLSDERRSLKRSLSDSALHTCNGIREDLKEERFDHMWPNKRKKVNVHENIIEPHLISESVCNIIQSNRRNSISSFYNQENVSFCILINNDCILDNENEEPEKICFTDFSENCLTENPKYETNEDEITKSSAEIVSSEEEKNCSDSFILEYGEEKTFEESWVEDIACVETVVSDDIAEDIVISATTSPNDTDLSDYESNNDESGIFNNNISDQTNKVKYIYGDKMCNDDAQLVETLYRTPQMNVNKTLTDRESQRTEDCNMYYDKNCFERIFSKSNECILHYESDCVASESTSLCPPACMGSKDIPNDKENLNIVNFNNFSLPNEGKENYLNTTSNKECLKNEGNNLKSFKTQDDTVNSCESSIDNVFSYNQREDNSKYINSSSPEVSSTTSEEKNSSILLKITNFKGSRISQIRDINSNNDKKNSCKFTEDKEYIYTNPCLATTRTLITKAAQKYIPPIKETMPDLKVKLPLPQHSLIRLKQLKISKEEPKQDISFKINTHKNNLLRKDIPKKTKPKFEDVLKSIDEIQIKMHKEKSKKTKKPIPKVVIKKKENGSHYASSFDKGTFNPDLTGRKWQPWVFLEKNHFIDKMALKNKTRAIYSYRKNTYVLAEKFQKYKSISSSTKFIISQPKLNESSTGQLKYTIRLKHNY